MKISVSQLFIMLFISRTIVNITYSVYVTDTRNMWEYITSCGITFILTLFMAMPVYYMNKKFNGESVLDVSYNIFNRVGTVIAIIYAVYFVWVLCYTLSLFDLFVTDLMNPKISSVALSLAVIGASIYGSYKGVEALARSSSIVFISIVALVLFIVCALFSQVDKLNIEPLFNNGVNATVDGVLFMIARNSCIPVMAVALSLTNGGNTKIKKGIFWWCFGIYATSAVLIYLSVGVLGRYYLATQTFPIYTVASVAQIGIFKRLDAVFLGVWTAGIFIKSSLFIYLVSLCIKKIWGEKASKIAIAVTGAIVFLCSFGISSSQTMVDILFNNYILLSLTILTAVVIPLILLLKKRRA